MRWETIHKPAQHLGPGPNMTDYAVERARFSWQDARRALDGLPGGRGLNIAHEAVDRHASGQKRDHEALRCVDRDGNCQNVTYGELAQRSSRFANALDELGVQPGERVFVLMPRTADLYVAGFGTLKHRSVLCPLFAAFGPEPIRQRLELGTGVVLVTTPTLYRRKVAGIRDRLPALRHVLLAGGPRTPGTAPPDGTLDLNAVLAEAGADYEIAVHRSARHGAAALHERHHRHTQGCGPRTRGGRFAPRDRSHRLGPAPRRRVLVHGRSRLGDGHVLRHHLPAGPRRDEHRRRGRLRRRALVPSARDRGRDGAGTRHPPPCAC